MNEPETLRKLLQARTIAVIGLSDDPNKPSHSVSSYMHSHGYQIFPVNPSVPTITLNGATLISYPSLSALPLKPDLVNVFRLPKFLPDIVGEMIALDLKQLWVQLGIRSPEAAALAEFHGIQTVMDRCILIEHRRLD